MPRITVRNPRLIPLRKNPRVAPEKKKKVMPANPNNPDSLKKFLVYWLPVIAYAGLIFLFSSIPARYIPRLFTLQNQVFHFSEYLVFALLINRAWQLYYPGHSFYRRFFLVFTFVLIYAIIDELHQAFIPGRNTSLIDIVSDGLGIIVANIFYRWPR